MRYLVDALAVSRSHGEHSQAVYAVVPADLGKETHVHQSWEGKGVKAIVYQRDATHSRLMRTLVEWAAIHKGGQAGRLSVVSQFADDPPTHIEQDYRSSQMIWALSDKSGQAARKFASLNPPIEWLSLLEQKGLMNLPMPTDSGVDWLGPRLQPVNPVSGSLHTWLLGHLDKPELVDRAVKRTSILGLPFRWDLHRKLWYLKESVPEPYRRFWELLGSTSVMDAVVELPHKAAELVGRLAPGECDSLLFIEATDQLRPIAVFAQPTLRRLLQEEGTPPKEVSDLAEFDLKLVADVYTHEIINGLKSCCVADSTLLPSALLSVTAQLERALKLFDAAGKASDDFDPSIFQMQSLRENSMVELHSWTALIALARDLLVLAKSDRALVRAIVGIWLRIKYPVFLRLALFGIYESEVFEPSESCHVLRELSGRQFWHYINEEFSVPLVKGLWPRIEEPESTELINMILDGPPKSLFRQDLTEEEFLNLADRMRFSFLTAMESTGRALPPSAASKLTVLRSVYTESRPADADADAVEGGWAIPPPVSDSAVDEYNKLTISEIANDIKTPTEEGQPKLELLRRWGGRYSDRALDVLEALVVGETQGADSLEALIRGLSSLETIPERMIIMIPKLGNEMRVRVASTLLSWMERTSRNEAINSTFLAAWDSLSKIATTAPLADTEDVFKSAFSSQIGQLTVLLLNRWIATAPKRGSGLQPEVRERLVALLGKPDPASRVARVMTAAHLYALHFVDRTWTVSALIPLFDWSTSSASEMWQGYLFNARWYPDLLADLKPSLLVAFGKGNQLGEAAKRLWRVLADIATYAPSSLSDRELGDSLQSLRKEDLAFIGLSFDQILARAEVSERPSLWERGISRALRLWPLDKQLRSEELSGSLMAIAVHEQDLFEQVASSIEHLLAPVKNIQTILYHLCKTKLPETHPNTVARLLSLVIDPHGTQPHLDTDACQLLLRLKTAEPSVGQMFEFEKLARTGWFDV